jgi:hypothetical protein
VVASTAAAGATPGAGATINAALEGSDAIRQLVTAQHASATADRVPRLISVPRRLKCGVSIGRRCRQLLLDRGADREAAGAAWARPIEWARKKGHKKIEADLL